MGFLGVYKAVYDYVPQSEEELAISEGDVLYVLEKSEEDDWWKAKKKASADEEEEPVGLVPNNYVEEAQAVGQARALYEYTRQTDEELSFPEDAQLRVFDTSDEDWILVGLDGDYGFVPANYIEMASSVDQDKLEPSPLPPTLPTRPSAAAEAEEPPSSPHRQSSIASETSGAAATPASALAGVLQGRSRPDTAVPPPIQPVSPRQQYLSGESDEEQSPALPARPRSQSTLSDDHSARSPPIRATHRPEYEDEGSNRSSRIAPGGFHLYNINEMVSVMGKKKKMPTTLGVNLKTGVILIAPERAQDGPSQEWSADRMTHYSREGKHVFLELVRPSKSVDFHAGAKDTAEEIVGALGELSGAIRAEGLREVIMAGGGQVVQKKGSVLYDFMAQGDDEVTVAVGDEVIVVDDTKSDEWWQVRRLKNGKEGVVPSSYIEVTETIAPPTPTSGVNVGKSHVAQNRLEEERLTREAVRKDQRAAEVGPGMRLPERHSSLSARDSGNHSGLQRSKRENGRAEGSRGKSKPDPSKVRTWTDRSKSFSVEAQFLGLKDGKINLHKMNGVKIAVPVAKMSNDDVEYVERITGISLDEDKPLSEVSRRKSSKPSSTVDHAPARSAGASMEPRKPEYDWFQFFLSCDVSVGLCERYAQAFSKDSMDESVLPDVDASVLRNLGLREGDILKVMRHLDKRFGREGKKRNVSFAADDDEENASASSGLFSGPGGALRNNTRKGRPAPAVQTSDTVDPKAFSQPSTDAANVGATKAAAKNFSGFDDDAWDVKPSRQPETQAGTTSSPQGKAATSSPPQRPPTQSMMDLSLLSQPLEPTRTQSTASPPVQIPPAAAQSRVGTQQQSQAPAPSPQLPGATPGFFTNLSQQQTGFQPTQTGQASGPQPLNLGLGGNRQRPVAPQMTQGQGSLMPPPPSRPLSAPQSAQPSQFAPPPLQPQVTGAVPPGAQSMNQLNQQRQQQQYTMGGFQAQPTGQAMGFNPGFPQQPGLGPGQFVQPAMTGAPPMQSPFADPRPQQFSPNQGQSPGFAGPFNPGGQFPQVTGVNQFLPPALEPQRTGMPAMQPQQTAAFAGVGQNTHSGMNNGDHPAYQAPPMAPLQPQKTGPAPPVRFGVPEKIAPQPTGRRANLAHATPQNPFGF